VPTSTHLGLGSCASPCAWEGSRPGKTEGSLQLRGWMPSIAAFHVAGDPTPDSRLSGQRGSMSPCRPARPLLIRELSVQPIRRVALAFLDDRSCRQNRLDRIRFLPEQNLYLARVAQLAVTAHFHLSAKRLPSISVRSFEYKLNSRFTLWREKKKPPSHLHR
jgi:hypothetical protein